MKGGRAFLKNWLPVLVWMALIFTASTDLMSANQTSRFIGPFLRWLIPEISADTVVTVQMFVRKFAHLAEYAIFGALLLRALQGIAPGRAWVTAFLIAAVCAVVDEFHQSFVASRTGSPVDVMIDTCGALLGLAVYGFFARKARLRRERATRG